MTVFNLPPGSQQGHFENPEIRLKHLILNFNSLNHSDLDFELLTLTFSNSDEELIHLFDTIVTCACEFENQAEYLPLIHYIQNNIFNSWFKDNGNFNPYYLRLFDHFTTIASPEKIIEFIQNEQNIELKIQALTNFFDKIDYKNNVNSFLSAVHLSVPILKTQEFEQLSIKVFNLILLKIKNREDAVDLLYELKPQEYRTISQAYLSLYKPTNRQLIEKIFKIAYPGDIKSIFDLFSNVKQMELPARDRAIFYSNFITFIQTNSSSNWTAYSSKIIDAIADDLKSHVFDPADRMLLEMRLQQTSHTRPTPPPNPSSDKLELYKKRLNVIIHSLNAQDQSLTKELISIKADLTPEQLSLLYKSTIQTVINLINTKENPPESDISLLTSVRLLSNIWFINYQSKLSNYTHVLNRLVFKSLNYKNNPSKIIPYYDALRAFLNALPPKEKEGIFNHLTNFILETVAYSEEALDFLLDAINSNDGFKISEPKRLALAYLNLCKSSNSSLDKVAELYYKAFSLIPSNDYRFASTHSETIPVRQYNLDTQKSIIETQIEFIEAYLAKYSKISVPKEIVNMADRMIDWTDGPLWHMSAARQDILKRLQKNFQFVLHSYEVGRLHERLTKELAKPLITPPQQAKDLTNNINAALLCHDYASIAQILNSLSLEDRKTNFHSLFETIRTDSRFSNETAYDMLRVFILNPDNRSIVTNDQQVKLGGMYALICNVTDVELLIRRYEKALSILPINYFLGASKICKVIQSRIISPIIQVRILQTNLRFLQDYAAKNPQFRDSDVEDLVIFTRQIIDTLNRPELKDLNETKVILTKLKEIYKNNIHPKTIHIFNYITGLLGEVPQVTSNASIASALPSRKNPVLVKWNRLKEIINSIQQYDRPTQIQELKTIGTGLSVKGIDLYFTDTFKIVVNLISSPDSSPQNDFALLQFVLLMLDQWYPSNKEFRSEWISKIIFEFIQKGNYIHNDMILRVYYHYVVEALNSLDLETRKSVLEGLLNIVPQSKELLDFLLDLLEKTNRELAPPIPAQMSIDPAAVRLMNDHRLIEGSVEEIALLECQVDYVKPSDQEKYQTTLAFSYLKHSDQLLAQGLKEQSAEFQVKAFQAMPLYKMTQLDFNAIQLFPFLSIVCDRLLEAPPNKIQAGNLLTSINFLHAKLNESQRQIINEKLSQIKIKHNFAEFTQDYLNLIGKLHDVLTRKDLVPKIKAAISSNEGRCKIPLHHLSIEDYKAIIKSILEVDSIQGFFIFLVIKKLHLEIDPTSESKFLDANSTQTERDIFKALSENYKNRAFGVNLREVRFHHLKDVIYELICRQAKATKEFDDLSLTGNHPSKAALYFYTYPEDKHAFHLAYFQVQFNSIGTEIDLFKHIQSDSHSIEGIGEVTEKPTPEMLEKITTHYRQNPHQFYLIMPIPEKPKAGNGLAGASRGGSSSEITIGGIHGQVHGIRSKEANSQKRKINPDANESLDSQKKRARIQYISNQIPMDVDNGSSSSGERITEMESTRSAVVIRPQTEVLEQPEFGNLLDSIMFGFATKVVESLERVSKSKDYFGLEPLVKIAQPLIDISGRPTEPVQLADNNLKLYQNRALRTLLEADQKQQGMVLAFYPGLGKTLTSYFYLRELQRRDPSGRPCLIIADKSMTAQWQADLKAGLKDEMLRTSIVAFLLNPNISQTEKLEHFKAAVKHKDGLDAKIKALSSTSSFNIQQTLKRFRACVSEDDIIGLFLDLIGTDSKPPNYIKSLLEAYLPTSMKFIDSEIVIHTSENPCTDLARCREGYKFIITTASCLNNKHSESLKSLPFRGIICDEAHQYVEGDNSDKVIHKTVKSFFADLKSAQPDIANVLLTGTPLVNKPDDVISLIEIANPQLKLSLFYEAWLTRLNLATRRIGEDAAEGEIVEYPTLSSVTEGFIAFEYLRHILKQFVLSESMVDPKIRADWTVDGVCRLPVVVNHEVRVQLTNAQVEKIQQIVTRNPLMRESAEKQYVFHPDIKDDGESLVGRVKQLRSTDVDSFIKQSGLLEAFFEDPSMLQVIEQREGALVFVDTIVFGKVLEDLIRLKFGHLGVQSQFFYGQLSDAERKSMVHWYKKHEPKVPKILIVSTGAGGVGLNLQSRTVHNLSPLWTEDTQSMARAVRANMVGEVHIYRYKTSTETERLKTKIVALKSAFADYLLRRHASLQEGFSQFKKILTHKIDNPDLEENLKLLLDQITDDLFEDERNLKSPYKKLLANLLAAKPNPPASQPPITPVQPQPQVVEQVSRAAMAGPLALAPASFYPKTRYTLSNQLKLGTIPLPAEIDSLDAASLTAHFLLNQRGEAIPTALRKFEKMSEPQWNKFWDSQELNQWFHETFKIGPLALTPFNRQIYTPRNGELILSNETRQPEITTPTVRILQTSHNGQPRFAILLKLV